MTYDRARADEAAIGVVLDRLTPHLDADGDWSSLVRRAAESESRRPLTLRPAVAVICVAALVVLATAVVVTNHATVRQATDRPTTSRPILDGTTPAPPLTGIEVSTGRTISLSDYSGRPVVIHVWAPWCAPCRADARVMSSFARRHREITVLGVVVSSQRLRSRQFIQDAHVPYASLNDPRGALAVDRLSVRAMPTTFYVDRNGVIRGTRSGRVTRGELDAVVTQLIP